MTKISEVDIKPETVKISSDGKQKINSGWVYIMAKDHSWCIITNVWYLKIYWCKIKGL